MAQDGLKRKFFAFIGVDVIGYEYLDSREVKVLKKTENRSCAECSI